MELPMNKQIAQLDHYFSEYKDGAPQKDDVTIVGIKF
jgi:hypothetical protein